MAEKPFFLPRKEVNLFDHLNQELIDDIIGQTVDIYKVKIDDTTSNIYGESDDGIKYFEKGFRVNCLIQFNEPEVEYEDFGADLNSSIENKNSMISVISLRNQRKIQDIPRIIKQIFKK